MKQNLIVSLALLVAVTSFAQFNPTNIPPVDTNVNMFALSSLSIRAGGTYSGANTPSASADLGVSFAIFKDVAKRGVDVGVGADMLMSTGGDTVQQLQVCAEFGVPLNNIKFTALMGGGRDWDHNAWFGAAGGRLEYKIGEHLAAFTQDTLQIRDINVRPGNVIVAGVSYHF